MATVTFIKYQRQSAGALHGVADYVSQKYKTQQEDGSQLVSGQNCTPQLAAQEFLATRQMHRKNSPVWFYHYVQSFAPEEQLTGALAHQVAREFAEQAWPDSEVLIATHTDAEHVHSHFVVNAVCPGTGKMLRQGPDTLRKLRAISDGLCMKHGLSVLPRQRPKRARGLSTREYRSAVKGESWKFRLMNTIDRCMKYASTKAEFLALMEREGYQVRWTDGRKSITYTTPTGMKCRDDRLHDGKYTKEVMEHEFRIRAAFAHGGVEAEERSADLSQQGGVGQSADDDQRLVSGDGGAGQSTGEPGTAHSPSAGDLSRSGAAGGAGGGYGPDPGDAATGWEAERALCFAAQSEHRAVRAGMAGPDFAGDHGRHGSLAGALVRFGRTLERGQNADPVRDATTMPQHTDSKTLRREQKKKIALGHREGNHEEKQTWQQTM